MKSVTKQFFESFDGKLFEDEALCKLHEDKIRDVMLNTHFFCVTHSPDLTEGRGYYGTDIIAIYSKYAKSAEEYVFAHYLKKNNGHLHSFVQGVQPMAAFIIRKVSPSYAKTDKIGIKWCIFSMDPKDYGLKESDKNKFNITDEYIALMEK